MKKIFKVAVVLFVLCFCFSLGVSAEDSLRETQITERLNQASQEVTGNLELCETKIAISSAADLKSFRDRVNKGESTLSAYLTCDIDLNNEEWMPIGTVSNPFCGSFNGYSHNIFNLYCNYPDNYGGLFGSIEKAYIHDVVVIGEIVHNESSGGIAGSAKNSIITNCGNICDIYTDDATAAGGIVGISYGDYDPEVHSDTLYHSIGILGCFNAGYVYGIGENSTFVGGISGMNLGYVTIAMCYNTCTVGSESGPAGGIVGSIGEDGFVGNTYSVGEIDNEYFDTFGELCGFATENGMIANSYYCYTGYHGININQSTASHTMHYVTNVDDLKTNAFIAAINGGNTTSPYFVADKNDINDGFPVLNWEKAINYYEVEGIVLNKTVLSLNIGEKSSLQAAITPSNATNKVVTWKSSNPAVVSVDNSGNITALKAGSANITVTSQNGGLTASCKVTVTDPNAPTISFGDVKSTDYFYTPVNWAVANNITTGVGGNSFAPNQTCTRGQTVTFLWRAAGCPEPTGSSNPFTDVKSSDYFYKAVLWAVGKNITTGTSNTTFSPNQGCTRGQVVTFLWRANGQPKVSANNPFSDVKAGAYYYTAVLWAVNKNITKGTSSTAFSPNATCIRGQIVTFLYRNYN